MYETDNSQNKNRYIGDYIFDMGTDLKLIVLFTIVTLGSLYIPVVNQTIVRLVFSMAILFFIPGYALTAVLYPKNDDISVIERAALSFGISISICPIIELVLCYTPWGLRLAPLVICLTAFTIACVLTASVRRHKFQEEDRFFIDFAKAYRSLKAAIFDDQSGYDKALTALLLLTIFLAGAMIVFVVIVPRQVESFTEFYILDQNNTTDNYPNDIKYGDSAKVTAAIVNHENRNIIYDLVVLLNDGDNKYSLYHEGNISIADNQSWTKPLNLTLTHNGTGMKLDFVVYADGNTLAPYRECFFWVNVLEP
jgi:uncharacterized membrane protein